MIAEDSTFFSMVDRVIHELALHDRKVLQRLRAMAIREADATVGDQMKEDALRAFADKAERALEEAQGRWHGCTHGDTDESRDGPD
jgi:predicted secreted protein